MQVLVRKRDDWYWHIQRNRWLQGYQNSHICRVSNAKQQFLYHALLK
jgi:hypothetical protein